MTLVVATMTMTSPMIHADTHLPYTSLNDQWYDLFFQGGRRAGREQEAGGAAEEGKGGTPQAEGRKLSLFPLREDRCIICIAYIYSILDFSVYIEITLHCHSCKWYIWVTDRTRARFSLKPFRPCLHLKGCLSVRLTRSDFVDSQRRGWNIAETWYS